jgi:hypothetical protein
MGRGPDPRKFTTKNIKQVYKIGQMLLCRTYLIEYLKKRGMFWIFSFFKYDIQHCFICRPSDSTASEDAGIEPRTVATTALAFRRSNHSARSHQNIEELLTGCSCVWPEINAEGAHNQLPEPVVFHIVHLTTE